MFKPVCLMCGLFTAAIVASSAPLIVESADPPVGKVGAIGDGSLVQKIVARRIAAEKVAESESITKRAALRLIDKINDKATPEQLAAASGLTADDHKDGLLSETTARALCVKSGVKMPVMAIGDGTFLKWLFSDDGRAAVLKWAEEIVKIVAILAPLFA